MACGINVGVRAVVPPCIPPAMQASCGSFQFYPILYFQLASLEYDNVCIIHDVETKAIRKLNITTSTQGCALD